MIKTPLSGAHEVSILYDMVTLSSGGVATVENLTVGATNRQRRSHFSATGWQCQMTTFTTLAHLFSDEQMFLSEVALVPVNLITVTRRSFFRCSTYSSTSY